MSIEIDLLDEVKENYGQKVSDDIDIIMEKVYNAEENIEVEGYDVNVSVEKIHSLHYNYYIDVYREDINLELSFVVESSINVGTMMREYSFSGDLKPKEREYEVFSHIEFDESKFKKYCELKGFKDTEFLRNKALTLFERYKSEIEKLYKNQSYDNYVTGGGTSKTNSYYSNKLNELEDKGCFWKDVYKTVKADINWK